MEPIQLQVAVRLIPPADQGGEVEDDAVTFLAECIFQVVIFGAEPRWTKLDAADSICQAVRQTDRTSDDASSMIGAALFVNGGNIDQ